MVLLRHAQQALAFDFSPLPAVARRSVPPNLIKEPRGDDLGLTFKVASTTAIQVPGACLVCHTFSL